MFEIFNIFHKAEFQYHHIYDCDLNTCKQKGKKRSNFENLGFGNFFLFFLVLTRDRNNFETKMSLSKHRNLRFSKFKIFVGNFDSKSWRSQKRSDMQSLLWNVWIFNMKNLSLNYTQDGKLLQNWRYLKIWFGCRFENFSFWKLCLWTWLFGACSSQKFFSWQPWL